MSESEKLPRNLLNLNTDTATSPTEYFLLFIIALRTLFFSRSIPELRKNRVEFPIHPRPLLFTTFQLEEREEEREGKSFQKLLNQEESSGKIVYFHQETRPSQDICTMYIYLPRTQV